MEEMESIIQHIPKLVSNEKNESLMQPITPEEVIEEINDMPTNKSPGLDGLTTNFFQSCWSTIQH